MLDLTSAENVMKMQQCLSDLTADVSADMIENMVGELFTERQKQVVELNGEVDDAVDGIDGSRPVVINPPPGLGLLTFKKRHVIQTFTVNVVSWMMELRLYHWIFNSSVTTKYVFIQQNTTLGFCI